MDGLTIQTNSASAEVLAQRKIEMQKIEDLCKSQVQWYQTETVAEYRRRRSEGIGFPKPVLYNAARTVTIPSRDGRTISLRLIQYKEPSKGVILHFHAGGFVIGSSKSYDSYLLHLSQNMELTAVSVEYSLAPEAPYPASQNDALDAALFALSQEGEAALGGPLKILAGESAGGYLATWVALELRSHGIDTRSKISALIASYPIYDLTYTPSLLCHKREAVLSSEGMKKFVDASFPGTSLEQRKDPKISLLYAELDGLPPALFLCGTEDPLLDDSVFMATKWSLAGNKATLCLIPGGWHAFTLIPAGEITNEGLAEVVSFAKKYL